MDKVVESIDNLKLSSKIIEHLKYTNEDYINLIKNLQTLDDNILKNFLRTLRNREIVNNQETELEESFLVELYLTSKRKNSIEVAMELLEDKKITKDEIKKLHRIVIKDSSDDKKENYDFRQDNEKWVGYFGTGNRQVVQYMPPDYNEIDPMMDYILKILNDDETTKDINHPLIKPIVAHGFLAYLQAFGNGNTRLARVLQHGKIWQMTNDFENTNLELPVLYLSKNYLMYHKQYRDLTKDIAIDQNWESWLNFNLNMMDEQLNYTTNNLETIKKMIRHY